MSAVMYQYPDGKWTKCFDPCWICKKCGYVTNLQDDKEDHIKKCRKEKKK